MKIQEAIDWADEMKPNAFTSKVKLAWLNALEGRIAADVFLMAPAEIAVLRYTEEDMGAELLVAPRRYLHPVASGQDRRGKRGVQQVRQQHADLQ